MIENEYKSRNVEAQSTQEMKNPPAPGLPPHLPHLQVGIPVMLLRFPTSRQRHQPLHEAGKSNCRQSFFQSDEDAFISRIPFTPSGLPCEFELLVSSFFALSIGKSPGQSLKVVDICLRK